MAAYICHMCGKRQKWEGRRCTVFKAGTSVRMEAPVASDFLEAASLSPEATDRHCRTEVRFEARLHLLERLSKCRRLISFGNLHSHLPSADIIKQEAFCGLQSTCTHALYLGGFRTTVFSAGKPFILDAGDHCSWCVCTCEVFALTTSFRRTCFTCTVAFCGELMGSQSAGTSREGAAVSKGVI